MQFTRNHCTTAHLEKPTTSTPKLDMIPKCFSFHRCKFYANWRNSVKHLDKGTSSPYNTLVGSTVYCSCAQRHMDHPCLAHAPRAEVTKPGY